MCDPVRLTLDQVRALTYRQLWDLYIEPNLEQPEEGEAKAPEPVVGNDGWVKTPRKQTGGFGSDASKEEMDRFLDRLCGSRVYAGPKWWVPGVVPGIQRYQGPGKPLKE